MRIVQLSGNVTVRTWNREAVQVDGQGVEVRRTTATVREAQSMLPVLAGRTDGAHGPIVLPEETFAVSTLAPGEHDVITVHGPYSKTLIFVPQDAGLVSVVMGSGSVIIRGYRGGTFVTRVRNGAARLINVSGDGFVQVMRGPIIARHSSFQRLRARSGTGDIAFERCDARQIEVSSIEGSILYDDGTFQPGLARFESQAGNVAIGVNGASQLGARANSGHVYTMFDRNAQVDNKDSRANVTVAGGGPLVNISSANANVYLYDGALGVRGRVPPEWDSVAASLRRNLQRPLGLPPGIPALPAPVVHNPASTPPPNAGAPQPHPQSGPVAKPPPPPPARPPDGHRTRTRARAHHQPQTRSLI